MNRAREKAARQVDAAVAERKSARREVVKALDAFTADDLRRAVQYLNEDALRALVDDCAQMAEHLGESGNPRAADNRRRVGVLCEDLLKARLREAGVQWA